MKPFNFTEPKAPKIPKERYPNVNSIGDDYGSSDFYDFRNGVNISSEQKQKWVNEALDYLNEHPDESYYSIASGNTFVYVCRHEEGVTIRIANSYIEALIDKNE